MPVKHAWTVSHWGGCRLSPEDILLWGIHFIGGIVEVHRFSLLRIDDRVQSEFVLAPASSDNPYQLIRMILSACLRE